MRHLIIQTIQRSPKCIVSADVLWKVEFGVCYDTESTAVLFTCSFSFARIQICFCAVYALASTHLILSDGPSGLLFLL